ncbi:TPA: pyrroline-5-carboxylate reductase [Xanthomonas vasicola pv. zeae]|uniref:Pyrroline-5-carboxylate reductase n=2 Tax=Xanthomonas vasicola pv. vasculorum TaxID=325776 RepID=A0A836ZU22_XANVA|nr:pyrroline-5-carboxylate reductase [Xanthomonas vasicola]AVQ07709.1 pyrroline-5-carboxylate reductase [Xanthomonas vasicola pv. vasculorum]AZM71907.1 pyrroline-5-carboxylate reductase [Xanthomonas vasicola pv. vasculorum]AZR26663.1 pyrroline-5-carboxylate reductase [Xanthomonas vasicola pv. arecae]KEZ95103.1 pyrroline-5-carboxylate reductase [Xanthomonas vasicola pv. vasculorum NCPPB 895]KFA25314.1 pyrroline-5-carboxylate reductase [Xanthomonas vasicola pv. vasculorum NCPPB 1326]
MTTPVASTPSSSSSDAARIAFVGGGNMARSLIAGLIRQGTPADSIRVAEPVAELRDALARDFGVQVVEDARTAVDAAATWVLAVKPQVLPAVCRQLADLAQAQQPLLVSIAAGITATQLQRWSGGDVAVVRAMPNTPALLGAGVTGLYANARVSDAQRKQATRLLDSAGVTVWIDDEAQMDAVTAVSGSGPAYVFLLAEAMEAAAQAQGLPPDTARTLVLQTLLGAARMLTESGEAPDVLRRRVTSPNGTTHAAIETFQAGGFEALAANAIAAATERGRSLSAAND